MTANCLHPGLVNSHLFHDSPALLRGVLGELGRTFMLSPQQGARTSIYLASSPEVAGASGGLLRSLPARHARARRPRTTRMPSGCGRRAPG